MTSSWRLASRAARIISKSSMELSHILMLAAMVSSKRSRSIWEMGLPSNRISPLQGWYSPEISLARVDFPQPEGPVRATRSPGLRVRLKS